MPAGTANRLPVPIATPDRSAEEDASDLANATVHDVQNEVQSEEVPSDEGLDNEEGPAEMLDQADENTSSTEGGLGQENPESRGRPHPDRSELVGPWRQASTARINALSQMFGTDALVLGNLLFRIPPLSIRITKGNITYRWKSLRTKESIAVKSGNGECYIEIDLVFNGLREINDSLSPLIAIFKKFPFCFVENAFIRSQMIPDRPEDSMMLCLESMVIDSVAGSPGTIWVTLVTSWFNYKPFSMNGWYRRTWQSVYDTEDNTTGPPDDADTTSNLNNTNEEDVEPVEQTIVANSFDRIRDPIPHSDLDTTIIDLSALEDPDSLQIAAPPEFRLEYPSLDRDPADHLIKPTYPVAYPWNSVPFMQRLLTGPDSPKLVPTWNDGISFKWNSFIRRAMPRSLVYEHDNESIEITRGGGGRRGAGPAGEGANSDRNIILFIGDSITVGYLGLTQPDTDRHRRDEEYVPIPMYNITPPSEISNAGGDGWEYYSIAQTGAPISTFHGMAARFEELIGSNEFRTPGGEAGSKLACVVFMGGINDKPCMGRRGGLAPISRIISKYEDIILWSKNAGALVCPMTPWPVANIRDDYINEHNEEAVLHLCSTVMDRWAGTSTSKTMAINLHDTRTTNTDPLSTNPDGFDGHMPEEIVNADGFEGGVDPHPNREGKRRLARHIARSIPWQAMREVRSPRETWGVCFVEDGDTIWVSRRDDVRVVRFKYMNTLETYSNYANPEHQALFGNPDGIEGRGTGQDSGRPTEQQFGRMAKEQVCSWLGANSDGSSNGTSCEIEFDDSVDAHGRHLGVVFRNNVNINLSLVELGLADVNPEYSESTQEALEYRQAKEQAEEAQLGIFGWETVSSIEATQQYTNPWDWTTTYPPDEGGFGYTTDNPPPDCVQSDANDETEEGDAGGADADADEEDEGDET